MRHKDTVCNCGAYKFPHRKDSGLCLQRALEEERNRIAYERAYFGVSMEEVEGDRFEQVNWPR